MPLFWKRMPPVALTIAGSDPSGGAGIQAGLKTFHQFGVYGEAVISLITVQNSVRVSRVHVLAVDPVMLSKHGPSLLDEPAVTALRAQLLRYATLVTPNLPEAAVLSGIAVR